MLALNAIEGLINYYQSYYADFYQVNRVIVDTAIKELRDAYAQSVYVEQKSDWDSHPNNVGHEFSPGCFRCHDGKHMNDAEESIRLECNICHSIPVIARTSDFVTDIEISHGPEPETHLNSNWIGLHRDVFDHTCQNCHTTEDPGGISDTSFCSNSACHGNVWEYAGFDAPALRQILIEQLPPPVPEPELETLGPLTFDGIISTLLEGRCGSCHGVDGIAGLNITTYDALISGGISGPAVKVGDPDNSLVTQKQNESEPHFVQLTTDEIQIMIDWIAAGAPEN